MQQEEEEVPFVFEVGDSGVMAALNRAILNITGQPPSSTSHACLHMRGRPTSTLVVCITTLVIQAHSSSASQRRPTSLQAARRLHTVMQTTSVSEHAHD